MRTMSATLLVSCLIGGAAPTAAQPSTPSPQCQPLYDAVRKALAQPGIERTVVLGDPARPDMRLQVRKTTAGWYQRRDDGAWQPMAADPEAGERRMLENTGAFTQCVPAGTEAVDGEPAQMWRYVAKIGPGAAPSQIWISVGSGLPLKVQAQRTVQRSTYRSTPFPKP
jgi:hypothetical protein